MALSVEDQKKQFDDLISSYKKSLKAKQLTLLREAQTTLQSLVQTSPILNRIPSLLQTVAAYEDPNAQEIALSSIGLEQIYAGVDKRTSEQETRIANGEDVVKLGYTDFIVLETLKWFKHDFFKWTNEPEVPGKGKPKIIRTERSNEVERMEGGANVTEIYQCPDGTIVRYPRYNNPVKLLETKNGRCGEWANCFCLILRSLGIRIRYVWNAEDHVWCEVYSEALGRWVHVDSCEEAFDNPTLYNRGWGKKMSYCLAVGIDSIADVSKRYIVDNDKQLPRDKVNEQSLQKAIRLFNALQRRTKGMDELFMFSVQDHFESLELNGKLVKVTKTTDGSGNAPRQSGSVEWTTARGEAGQ